MLEILECHRSQWKSTMSIGGVIDTAYAGKVTNKDSMCEAVSTKGVEIAEVCRRYGVTRLNVVGSAARAVNFEPERSDADFLVDLDGRSGLDRIFDLTDDLEAVLGFSVDLRDSEGVRDEWKAAYARQDHGRQAGRL